MWFWRAACASVGLWFIQAVQDASDTIMQEVKYIWPTTTWRVPTTKPSPSGKTLLAPEVIAKLAEIGEAAFDKYVRDVLPVELKADPEWAEEFANSDASRINEAFLRWQKRVYHQHKRAPLIDLSWDGSPIPKYENVSYTFPELYNAPEFKQLGKLLNRLNSMYLNHIKPDDMEGHPADRRFKTFIWIEVYRYADSHRPRVRTGACAAGMFFARYTQSAEGAQKLAFEDSRGINPPFGKTKNFDPRQGDVLIFPPWVSHFLTPHRKKSTNVYFGHVSWYPDGANGMDWEEDVTGDYVVRKVLKIHRPNDSKKGSMTETETPRLAKPQAVPKARSPLAGSWVNDGMVIKISLEGNTATGKVTVGVKGREPQGAVFTGKANAEGTAVGWNIPGIKLSGTVEADGRLHNSDGKIWTRQVGGNAKQEL